MNAFPTDICLSISSSSGTSILSWAGGEQNAYTGIASSASSASAMFAKGPASGAVRSWRKETKNNAKFSNQIPVTKN